MYLDGRDSDAICYKLEKFLRTGKSRKVLQADVYVCELLCLKKSFLDYFYYKISEKSTKNIQGLARDGSGLIVLLEIT